MGEPFARASALPSPRWSNVDVAARSASLALFERRTLTHSTFLPSADRAVSEPALLADNQRERVVGGESMVTVSLPPPPHRRRWRTGTSPAQPLSRVAKAAAAART